MNRLASLLGVVALCLGASAAASEYPSRLTTLVVPFPPGGSTDVLARQLAERLSKASGQPVVVENKAGAGGTVGSQAVARAAPDGYTLVMGVTGSHSVSYSLYEKPPYDPVKDFAPVSMIVSAPLVLAVNASLPIQDTASFIAYAKANPGKLTYGSPGNGTSMHLTGEMFDLAAGTDTLHIPYKGSAAATNDLLGGQIDAMYGDVLVLMPHLTSGRIRAIAVTGAQRHPMLPEVPTIAESGVPGFESLSWQGLFAPAGTPEPVIQALSRNVGTILRDPQVQAFFAGQGFTVAGNSPAEFGAFVQAETAKWADIVAKAGVERN
ncbi:tripartite tricarboxylate transporter substrate binding protein [Achromobacter sp. GG226]|uniref:Bug family tripartite tricarboxylate transporter substrate binding protein n=1 Tax=Verticiella alkaliphila TaxID=2779529 RepID=UPI001C0E4EF5|nr:tripartite tricarboxylate transporter substrate binding protein [Verticiella sp. GG226]MBU4609550.1 tripartite tricarboxylate transporter substrate binding protein [Verticiella sp. GG226]